MIDFSKKYNFENFDKFLNFFLPENKITLFEDLTVPTNYKFFKSVRLLYDIPSLNNLKVLEIEHNTSIFRKITITKELSKFMSDYTFSNCLIVFKSENDKNYRFSLIHSSLEWKGDTSVKKVFSEPKRYSFLLGENIKQYTPKQFLINRGKIKDYKDLLNRFDVEIVSEEFFNKYKNIVENLILRLEKDINFKKFTKNKNISVEIFVKKLLGQIVFCYFLQKKGWLGAKEEQDINDGDFNFIRNIFKKAENKKQNFYNDYLEYIFYEGFNKKNTNNFINKLNFKIPFLGGGLFEPLHGYDWKKETLDITNDFFSNVNSDGILDIFDLYNFTVDEQSEVEKEIAVDPEMLGKVFEKLLPENIKKSSGSYYTPRPIVEYMCKKSILEFLYSNFKNKIKFDKISELIFNLKEDNLNIYIEEKALLEIKNEAKNLLDTLDKLKICDPSVGSGAFLVSALDILTKLKIQLFFFLEKKIDIFELKKQIIENTLYGVDIDLGAVEIAKLRLWLSLIVDENDYKKIQTLPNLDYKILQGDSLNNNFDNISLDLEVSKNRQLELGDELNHEKETMINDLKSMQKKYFLCVDQKQKDILKEEILKSVYNLTKTTLKEKINFDQNLKFDEKNLKDQIYGIKPKKFFSWKIYFIEVFEEKKGFDIIVGNPPWRSLIGKHERGKDSKEILTNLKKSYITNSYMPNLYEFFLQCAYNLTAVNGIISYIIPDRFGFNYTSKIFRKFFLDNTRIIEVIYNWDFPEVIADTMTILIRKNVKADYKITIKHNQLSSKVFSKKSDIFKDDNIVLKKYKSVKHKLLVDKIISISKPLKIFSKITSGFGGKSELLTDEKINDEQIEVIKGRSIERFSIIKKYFFELKDKNITGRTRDINKLSYKGKILFRVTGLPIISTFDESKIVPEASLHFIYNLDKKISPFYLVGLLNSDLLTWFAINYGLITNPESTPHLKIDDAYKFPIILLDKNKDLEVTKIVKGLFKNNKNEILYKELNDFIFKTFNLNNDEISLIQKDISSQFNKSN